MPQKPREQDPMGRFQCPTCEEWKGPEEFFHNAGSKYGISTYCKICFVSNQRKYRNRKKERKQQAIKALEEALKPDDAPDNAIYVAGYGWMIPIGKPELPERRPLHARKDVVQEASATTPVSQQDQIPKYLKQLRAMTDEQLQERASFSKPWEIPEDQQSPFDKALLAELVARFGKD